MAEFRRDPIIGQWVVVLINDSWGPEKFPQEPHVFKQPSRCQFCPGRESMTPPELECVRLDGSNTNTPGWQVRVIPNKFPALRIEGELNRRQKGLLEMSNGIGAHEVIIETPVHEKDLTDLTDEEMVYVIQKYQSRVIDLSRDKRFQYVVIFRNYGESAGATVEHAHSQIIALPMVPKSVLEELKGAQEYYHVNQRCVFCDIVAQEYQDKERMVSENDDFITFCPFVSRYPFECWIIPKNHRSEFETISNGEQHTLASILKETLIRIRQCLHNPSYNYYLHIAPVNYERAESYHWHIEIVPKLTQVSGFEWGTGFYVVRTAPEMAARYLREAKINS